MLFKTEFCGKLYIRYNFKQGFEVSLPTSPWQETIKIWTVAATITNIWLTIENYSIDRSKIFVHVAVSLNSILGSVLILYNYTNNYSAHLGEAF